MDICFNSTGESHSTPKYHWVCQWLMGVGRICYFYSQDYTGKMTIVFIVWRKEECQKPSDNNTHIVYSPDRSMFHDIKAYQKKTLKSGVSYVCYCIFVLEATALDEYLSSCIHAQPAEISISTSYSGTLCSS